MNFINSYIALNLIVDPTEMTVFLQDHLNNLYSLSSYYSVKILTDFPMQVCFMYYYLLIIIISFSQVLPKY